jgi:hypothetical protein
MPQPRHIYVDSLHRRQRSWGRPRRRPSAASVIVAAASGAAACVALASQLGAL